MKQTFEFFCNDCIGYILVRLNVNLDNHRVLVVCPNCGREHPRVVVKAELKTDVKKDKHGFYCSGDDRYNYAQRLDRNHDTIGERIVPMKSAYSKERRLEKVEKGGFLAEKWLEKAEAEKHG